MELPWKHHFLLMSGSVPFSGYTGARKPVLGEWGEFVACRFLGSLFDFLFWFGDLKLGGW